MSGISPSYFGKWAQSALLRGGLAVTGGTGSAAALAVVGTLVGGPVGAGVGYGLGLVLGAVGGARAGKAIDDHLDVDG